MEAIKKYGIIGVFVVLSVVYFVLTKEPTNQEFLLPEVTETPVEVSYIYVDIKGAVAHPGVYKLETDSRLFQVVQKAGGLLHNADDLAINLSQTLSDEMVIYVPLEGEDYPLITDVIEDENNGIVNINLANQVELETLPGIGPSTALSIIAYRDEFGQFESVEELLNVSGIGEQTLADIKDYITI